MREAIRGRLALLLPSQQLMREAIRADEGGHQRPPHPPVAIPEAAGFRHIPQRACGRPRATGSGAGPPANSGEVIRGGHQGRSEGEVIRGGHQGRSSARTSAPHASSAVIRGHQRSSAEVISAHLEHRDRLRILALMIGNQVQSPRAPRPPSHTRLNDRQSSAIKCNHLEHRDRLRILSGFDPRLGHTRVRLAQRRLELHGALAVR